jgi:uncharacterized protein (TIGR03435 family)
MPRPVALVLLLGILSWSTLAQRKFEVASVKLNKPGERAPDDGAKGNRYTYLGNVRKLIRYAYDIRDHQLTGGPDWLGDNTWFEVSAKAEGEAVMNPAEAREMVRDLLATRFHLRMHSELHEIPVYHLAVQGKPKLTDSESFGRFFMNGAKGITTPGANMGELADMLSRLPDLDRPVIDKTGLSGNYSMTLLWAKAKRPETAEDVPEAEGASLFTALQEQFGLRLDRARDKVDVWVIDSVEKPSEN